MAKSEAFLAFNEITENHSLPREVVLDALRQALVSAYQKDSGIGKNQPVTAEVDAATNKYTLFVEKEVVESVTSPKTEITLEDAQKIKPEAALGDMLMAPVETKSGSFGRIAAQTAKQVILQKIRDAERRIMYDEYIGREGELVDAVVAGHSAQHVTLQLGKAEAIMPVKEQIREEQYTPGTRLLVYVVEVKDGSKGPQIIVSRAHRNLLRRLMERESPEINNGLVEIRAIVRDPGHRSKVAVIATQPGIDPLGACIGQNGRRIEKVRNQLNGERVDVVIWNADPKLFVAEALSPAKEIIGVYLESDPEQGETATVIVPDGQLTLAIGKSGQNARLAAKLTGWRIDIKKLTVAAMEAFDQIAGGLLNRMKIDYPEMVIEVDRIIARKRQFPEATLPPDENRVLERFVQIAEERLVIAREQARIARQKAIEKVRTAVPAFAFEMQLKELELAADILAPLRSIPNVGELMARLLADSEGLARTLKEGGAGDDAMDAINESIEALVLERQAEAEAKGQTLEMAAALPEAPTAESTVDEDAPPAFADVEPVVPRRPTAQPEPYRAPAAGRFERPEYRGGTTSNEPEIDITQGGKNKKKPAARPGGKKDREMVFDERAGRLVARKKHKGERDTAWTAADGDDMDDPI